MLMKMLNHTVQSHRAESERDTAEKIASIITGLVRNVSTDSDRVKRILTHIGLRWQRQRRRKSAVQLTNAIIINCMENGHFFQSSIGLMFDWPM